MQRHYLLLLFGVSSFSLSRKSSSLETFPPRLTPPEPLLSDYLTVCFNFYFFLVFDNYFLPRLLALMHAYTCQGYLAYTFGGQTRDTRCLSSIALRRSTWVSLAHRCPPCARWPEVDASLRRTDSSAAAAAAAATGSAHPSSGNGSRWRRRRCRCRRRCRSSSSS